MPTVFIPSLLRGLTGGAQHVRVAGATVREVIDALDEQYPGLKARLVEDGRLRRGVAVVVDGASTREGLRHRLDDGSEVHFVPAISGGAPFRSGPLSARSTRPGCRSGRG